MTPAKPHARVLFHLKGQDWPPGPGSLPCARLYAMHPEGTAHRACRVQVSGQRWGPGAQGQSWESILSFRVYCT